MGRNTVETVSLPRTREALCPLGADDTVLADGFWLFSEPQTHLLQSVQAVYAGVVMNPRQCRGQVEGVVAQAIGSSPYVHERITYNPVASALANAIARACGARLHQLSMTLARVWRELNQTQKGGGS